MAFEDTPGDLFMQTQVRLVTTMLHNSQTVVVNGVRLSSTLDDPKVVFLMKAGTCRPSIYYIGVS